MGGFLWWRLRILRSGGSWGCFVLVSPFSPFSLLTIDPPFTCTFIANVACVFSSHDPAISYQSHPTAVDIRSRSHDIAGSGHAGFRYSAAFREGFGFLSGG